MRDDCIQLLSKLDECLQDPDFQLLIIMKFLRNLAPYLQAIQKEGETNERIKRVSM